MSLPSQTAAPSERTPPFASRGSALVHQLEAVSSENGRSPLCSLQARRTSIKKSGSIRRKLMTGMLGLVPGLFLFSCGPLRDAQDKALDLVVSQVPQSFDERIGEMAWKPLESKVVEGVRLEPLARPVIQAAQELSQFPSKWSLAVISDSSPNAFAMPGGYIAFHTGFIKSATDALELQGVLAHEIGHVHLRHGVRRIVGERTMALLIGLVGSVVLGDLGSLGHVLTSGATQMTLLSFSRNQERDADEYAVTLLKKAGLSTDGMVRFFERLSQQKEKVGSNSLNRLSTHPLPEERMKTLKSLSSQGRLSSKAENEFFENLKTQLQ